MKARHILISVLVVFAGCAQRPLHETSIPCTPGICFVNIVVDDSTTPCSAVAIPSDVTVPVKSRAAPVELRWVLNTGEHVFAANGIVFDEPDQFDPKQSPKPNEIRFHDKATKKGTFHYVVNVDGCAPLDPYVRNL